MKLLFVIVVCSATIGRALSWTRANQRLRGLPAYVEESGIPPDRWFQQKLDHSDPTNPNTWWQRYQYNGTWYRPDSKSPIFLMIGGEGEASAEWLVEGAMAVYARKFHALSIQLEHRFYGKSFPTPDLSVQNLRYLSSEQALADIAYFIRGMNGKFKLSCDNKWIVFGGSYAGSLAAWARLKYPHLIEGAVSSSGPLLAKPEFDEYLKAVRSSLNMSSPLCANNVHSAALKLYDEVHDRNKSELVMRKFNLCDPVDAINEKDVSTFLEFVAECFSGVVQYNMNNRASHEGEYQNPTVHDICRIMTDDQIGSLTDRLAVIVQLSFYAPDPSFECLDPTYFGNVQTLMSTAFDNDVGGRPWLYQTCTEFGFFQTSSSKNDLFGPYFDLKYFVDVCEDVFDEVFDYERLQRGVLRSNLEYGALDIDIDRVVFVYGTEDPWHILGLKEANNVRSPVIMIEGASHCSNEYPPSPNDSQQLVAARKRIEQLLADWIGQ